MTDLPPIDGKDKWCYLGLPSAISANYYLLMGLTALLIIAALACAVFIISLLLPADTKQMHWGGLDD